MNACRPPDQSDLLERGLIHTEAAHAGLFDSPYSSGLHPLAVAIPKLVLGISRGRPVGYLAPRDARRRCRRVFVFLFAAIPRVTRRAQRWSAVARHSQVAPSSK